MDFNEQLFIAEANLEELEKQIIETRKNIAALKLLSAIFSDLPPD